MKKILVLLLSFLLAVSCFFAYAEDDIDIIEIEEETAEDSLEDEDVVLEKESISTLFQEEISEDIQQEQADEENKTELHFNDVTDTSYEEAVRLLGDLKIIEGYPDGTFRPYEKISRAEFAVIVSRFLSMDHIARVMTAEDIFSDVSKKHWAVREIKLANDKNIFTGYEDNTFRPEEYITYNQAIKVLAEALGYGKEASLKGGWVIGYKMMASELGITKNVEDGGENKISRGTVSLLLNNALKVTMPNGKTPESLLGEKNFYVAPHGADTNPGSEDLPWKTLKKAAQTAIPGTTVIFEDGTYQETGVTTFTNSGEKDAPITLKARNKHKAVIKYAKSMSNQTKFQITKGKQYINIRDFHFTQEQRSSTSTSDILVRFAGAENCEITGNKFDNVYEEGIKFVSSHNILVEYNVVIDPPHEGMDIFNCSNIIVRYNEFYDCGRQSLMCKGNARNCQLYNNLIVNEKVKMMTCGICIGGSSNNYDPFDIGYGTGFENYYTAVYNNVIISKQPGLIPTGINYTSSIGGRAFNNLIIGTTNGFVISETNAVSKGWEWNPPVIDAFIKNNIVVNCDKGIYFMNNPQGKFDCDYNIFYNVLTGTDIGGFEADPKLLDLLSDWRVEDDSPAIDKGGQIPSEYVGYGGEIIKIDMIDYFGNPREGKWDIGIYSAGN